MRYQIGFRIFGHIFWRNVSVKKFGERVTPLILQPGQLEGIKPNEIIPLFASGEMVLADGRTYYRAVKP